MLEEEEEDEIASSKKTPQPSPIPTPASPVKKVVKRNDDNVRRDRLGRVYRLGKSVPLQRRDKVDGERASTPKSLQGNFTFIFMNVQK